MRWLIAGYYLVYYGGLGAAFPYLTLYLHRQGLSDAAIGFVMSVNALAGLVSQPLIGAFSDRARDERTVLLVTGLLSPLALAGYRFVHGVWPTLAVGVIVAVIQSAGGPILDSIALQAGEKHGFTFGQVRLWGALGFALSTLATGYYYGVAGYGKLFAVYAVLTYLCTALLLCFPKQARTAHPSILEGMRTVGTHRWFLAFTFICFLLTLASAVNFTYFSIYFQALHYQMTGLGANFAIAALTEVPLFYLSSWLQARFGRVPILCVGTAMFAVKFAVVAMAPPLPLLLAIQVFDGAGFALTNSASVELVNALVPERWKATGQTVFAALSYGLSNILGTAVGGLVMATGGPQVLYWALSAVSAIAAVLFVCFGKAFARSQLQTSA